MHAMELADLANTFSSLSSALVRHRLPISADAAQANWISNRLRHESWSRRLAEHRDAIQRPGTSHRSRCWHDVLPVMQEILLSEPLARILAYHAYLARSFGVDEEHATLFQSALVAHVEARNRCLHLIVFGQGLPVESAVQLNRIRRLLESFNDQLIGSMPPWGRPLQFCFDTILVEEARLRFARIGDKQVCMRLHHRALSEHLWITLESSVDWRSANARLNNLISLAVLEMLPVELFDGFGLPKTGTLAALEFTSAETSGKKSCPACDCIVSPLDIQAPSQPPCTHPRSNPQASNETEERRW